jgi:hypothetical protein
MQLEPESRCLRQCVFIFFQNITIFSRFSQYFMHLEKRLGLNESTFIHVSLAVLVSLLVLPLVFVSVLAQVSPPPTSIDSNSSSPRGLLGAVPDNKSNNAITNETQLNSSSTSVPILTKISDHGIYKVQLKWSNPLGIQSPNILPKNGFDMEVLFLNATAPEPTNQTIPQKETNIKGETSLENDATRFSEPSSIQRLVPVDSFDITIYSQDGKVLWSKLNQPVTAGRAAERITFENGYTGGITILINNIKASTGMVGTTAAPLSNTNSSQSSLARNSDSSLKMDSVKFTAKVT